MKIDDIGRMNMAKAKKVSIIIVNWDGKELLKKCLESVKKHTRYPNYEVIVVDNGSKDDSQQMINEDFKWVKLIENEDNKGFSKGNNQGIIAGEGSYFFLLNNDTEVTENWLTRLVEIAESDKDIGIVGSGLLSDGKTLTGTGYVNAGGITKGYPESTLKTFIKRPGEVPGVSGAAMLIKKELINKIGMLDEGFTPAYFEETDLCARANDIGYKVIFAPSSLIYHWEFTKGFRPWEYYVMNKNRIRYMLLNFSKIQLLKAVPWEILRIFKNIFLLRIHLLFKAYLANLLNLKEIMEKRRERKLWAKESYN